MSAHSPYKPAAALHLFFCQSSRWTEEVRIMLHLMSPMLLHDCACCKCLSGGVVCPQSFDEHIWPLWKLLRACRVSRITVQFGLCRHCCVRACRVSRMIHSCSTFLTQSLPPGTSAEAMLLPWLTSSNSPCSSSKNRYYCPQAALGVMLPPWQASLISFGVQCGLFDLFRLCVCPTACHML